MKRAVLYALPMVGLLAFAHEGSADPFVLPSQVGDQNKLDLGFFPGGTTLDIQLSGTINLTGLSGFDWITRPDGSVVGPVTSPGYSYANPGATNYPRVNGGDGINHFPGGGANYDVSLGTYGFAGNTTTDTTDPAAIRVGAVVGTFSDTPTRDDWFFIGLGASVVAPAEGAHLSVAVVDTFYSNNTGAYSGVLTASPAPEPSSLVLLGVGTVTTALWCLCRRRKGIAACFWGAG